MSNAALYTFGLIDPAAGPAREASQLRRVSAGSESGPASPELIAAAAHDS